MLPEELRKRMAELKPRLDSGEGGGQIWEEVFLATDAALDTEDGATATAVLVWKDNMGNICLQVWPCPWSWKCTGEFLSIYSPEWCSGIDWH
jgi:hypothetical protein